MRGATNAMPRKCKLSAYANINRLLIFYFDLSSLNTELMPGSDYFCFSLFINANISQGKSRHGNASLLVFAQFSSMIYEHSISEAQTLRRRLLENVACLMLTTPASSQVQALYTWPVHVTDWSTVLRRLGETLYSVILRIDGCLDSSYIRERSWVDQPWFCASGNIW